MKNVEIYTWQYCPFCIRAKSLLKKKGVDYMEYQIDGNQEARSSMTERANGRTTVPQIFIGDHHVGGNAELQAANKSGQLDKLLA